MLQQLSVCTAQGVCAKHREQQGRHEQREHAHTAQVEGSALGRWPRLRAGRWVGAPAPTSRIGGSHSRGRRAQAATCDKARTTRVWGAAHTAWAAEALGWLRGRAWLRGQSLRSRPCRAHRPRARPAASTTAREARMPRTCDGSVRRALVRTAAKVRPVRVRGGECRARLGGVWLARAGGRGCVRRNEQRVGLARAGLRQHHSSVQGGALQPSVQYTRREHMLWRQVSGKIRRSSPLQASERQRCACAPWQGQPQVVCECARPAQPRCSPH